MTRRTTIDDLYNNKKLSNFNIIKCNDCGKELKIEEKDKTWNEIIKGFPGCKDCDNKILENVEKKQKTFKKRFVDFEEVL